MSKTVLKAAKREGRGKGFAKKLRDAGKIPAVVYGHNIDPLNLVVDGKDVEDLFRTVSVENTIISLQIEKGPKEPLTTLVREIQRHPWRNKILHLDFMQISMKETVNVEVPVVLLGTPTGVRNDGGILQHQMREVEISCLPSDILERIEVDVTELAIGDSVHVGDLGLEGVDLLSDPEGLVATILPPTVIKEEAAPEVEEEEGVEPGVVGEEIAAEEEKSEEQPEKEK